MLPRQLRQFLPGLGVGFSADWVSRKQGGDRNLGSTATQAPWLSRHATGPSLYPSLLTAYAATFLPAAISSGDYTCRGILIDLRPVSADLTPSR
jgi:hypothetical protein